MYFLNKIERHNLFYQHFLLWLIDFQFNPLLKKKCNWNGNLSLEGTIMQKKYFKDQIGNFEKKITTLIHNHINM
jgi:hypothetical protein